MRQFFRRWFKYLFFAGFFSIFVNVLYLTFPIYMLAVYDRVLASRSQATLLIITAVALFALIIFGILDFLRSRLLIQASVDMDKRLSAPVLAEMARDAARPAPLGYSEGLKDVQTLRNYFSGNAIFALFDLPWVPIYLVIIFLMHPHLGLLSLGGLGVVFALGVLQELMTRKRYAKSEAVNTQGQRLVGAAMRNSEAISAMGMTTGLFQRWRNHNDHALALQNKANQYLGLFQAVSKPFRMSMQVFIYGLGAYYVLQNEISTGTIIAASVIMGRALAPVDQLMGTWRQTVQVRGAIKRLKELLNTAAEHEAQHTELPAPAGRLDMANVTMAMGGRPVLHNISFSLEPGEQMGLIGPSGAGKSTLCRVLLGLWSPQSGKATLDGASMEQWDKEQLGRYIGYVPQDVELFAGTVAQNIARMQEVESERVVEAAQKSACHELILQLPNGYDTQVGEAGRNLSGGQRQRIALARALYDAPRLLVLDEPNSNLDDAGEKALMHTLQSARAQEATVIMVTHKPALLSQVDKVLTLKNGQVSLFGPREQVFQELMGSKQTAGSGQPQ